MGKVIKSDGKEQPFRSEKIKKSVEIAALQAGLAPNQIGDLVSQVALPVIEVYEKKDKVKTTELRKTILSKLDKKARAVSEAWKRYEKKKQEECDC